MHQNATVPGHAAYLMYTNGAFHDREEMAKVWYNSLFLLSSYSNFEDCALAVIKTTKNLGLSDQSINIIEDAFMETKMLEDTRIELKGNVYSGNEKLKDVTIEIIAQNNKNANVTAITDENGDFRAKLKTGTYKMTITKNGFKPYEKTLHIYGETSMKIELALENLNEEEDKEENSNHLSCKSKNCHTVTIYFLENPNSNGLKENYKTFTIDDGMVITMDLLTGTMNKIFGNEFIKTDGETFKMTMGDFTIDFAWYYKDTDKKFNFTKPITENIEIEMKLFNGILDNDFFQGIYDKFQK